MSGNIFFATNRVLLQDVTRLCPEFVFFQGESGFPRPPGVQPLHTRVSNRGLATETIATSRSGTLKVKRSEGSESSLTSGGDSESERHWEIIERILFIYAKLNPGIGYVQGMNEICGPLYYTMATHTDPNYRRYAEADTYWCFMELMADFRDNFIKTLDDSDIGIGALMNRLVSVLRSVDVQVHRSLTDKQIKPMFYGFRWLTCLMAQEFPLPDVIRLWDSLFSKQDRQEYLIAVCCSLVCLVREQILAGGFAETVKLLQHMPVLDSKDVLAKADSILAFQRGEATDETFVLVNKDGTTITNSPLVPEVGNHDSPRSTKAAQLVGSAKKKLMGFLNGGKA